MVLDFIREFFELLGLHHLSLAWLARFEWFQARINAKLRLAVIRASSLIECVRSSKLVLGLQVSCSRHYAFKLRAILDIVEHRIVPDALLIHRLQSIITTLLTLHFELQLSFLFN